MKEATKQKIEACVWVVVFALTMFLMGCKTKKVIDKTESKDSVRIEYREKLVKVPVTVYVEIPAEEKEKFTNDTTSHLETSFAFSDAAIVWIDGVAFLNHKLANKPQKIEKTDSVGVKEKTYYKIIYRTRYKSKIVEREPSLKDKFSIYLQCMGIVFGILLVFIVIWLVTKWRHKQIVS